MKSTAPLLHFLLLFLCISTCTTAFDYVVAPSATYRIHLTDVTTNVSDIPTVFNEANATVHVDGLQWQTASAATTGAASATSSAQLVYTTYINAEPVAFGSHNLSGMVPPLTVSAGIIEFPEPGRQNVTVTLQVVYKDDPSVETPLVSTSREYQVYWPILTLAPIVVLIGLAWLTGNVEISISTTNLVAVCISHGDFFKGMEHLVYGTFLGALTDPYNGVIMLLVFFLSGIMSLSEVSGGSKGWIRFVARYIHSTRIVQGIAFLLGLIYFWDDSLSILIVGHLMRPLLDVAHTSRPLGALILDATAGPISGIILLSTWLLWEIPLLQQELSRIDTLPDDLSIPALDMTPFQILQESLRFAFYPIFTLLLWPLLLWSQRHMGQVLMYERITQVYRSKTGGPKDIRGPCQPNLKPAPHTPYRFWNALFPLTLISILFIVFWFQTGQRGAEALAEALEDDEHGIVTTFAYALTPLAWLQAISMGAAFYVVSLLLQFQQGGHTILFVPLNIPTLWKQHQLKKQQQQHQQDDNNNDNNTQHAVISSPKHQHKQEGNELQEQDDSNAIVNANDNTTTGNDDRVLTREDSTNAANNNFLLHHDEEEHQEFAKPLLPMMELIASFFFGFSRIMPYMIQFILAWALRQTFTDIGLDRWFASILGNQLNQLSTPYIPVAAFLTAFFMSLATGGASRGKAASILLPMVMAPVYEKTHLTEPDMIFQVIGAILSGCIAGDHAAPLSNSTLLSCLASDCHVLVHVITQIPYIGVVLFLSLLLGTAPVGYGIYPLGAGYFLGVVCLLFFVFFICYPILDLSGQWDLVTRLYIRCWVKRKSKQNDNHNNVDEDDGGINNEDPEDNMHPSGRHNNMQEEEEEEGNFWDILQRDTARAATAMAEGIPYETEDCRHLMNPLDAAISKDENDIAAGGPTSSSGDEEEDEASIGMNIATTQDTRLLTMMEHTMSPVSAGAPPAEHDYGTPSPVVEERLRGNEGGRPVKIITPALS